MAKTSSRFAQSVSGLAYAPYRRFALSLLLTSMGAQLIQTAIVWQVYELTGSALLLGLTGLARAGPHIVLSLIGGVAADRVNRVRLIQAGQLANGILIFVLAILTLAGAVQLWELYFVTVLNGAFTALTQPARTALIPFLIPREKLVNAIALNASITQTSQIIGPAFAGLAIGVIGLGAVYLFNGLFYVLAMLAIFAIKTNATTTEALVSPWRSLLEGLSFVKGKSVIVALLALDLGETLLGSYRTLLPILATSLGSGVGGYGLLSAAPGVGSLFGTAFIMSLGDMKYKGLYTAFGVLAYCFALALLAVAPWLWLAVIASGLLGATNSIQVIPRNSAIIAISPDVMRGRVESFRSMLAGGGPPLGYTLSGVMAASMGAPGALLLGAVLCIAMVAGIVGVNKDLRDPYLGMSIEPPIEVPPEVPADKAASA